MRRWLTGLAILLLVLVVGAIARADFVTGNTTLPPTKTNLRALPQGADPSRYIQASDYNALMQADLDLRTGLTLGAFLGMAQQASDPSASTTYPGSNYLWVKNDGTLHFNNGSDHTVTTGTVNVGWVSQYDLDFTAQGTVSIPASDSSSVTIAGLTWTVRNCSTWGSASLTAANGLQFTPVTNASFGPGSMNSTCELYLPLSQIAALTTSNFGATYGFRLCAYFADNAAANDDDTVIAVHNGNGTASFSVFAYHGFATNATGKAWQMSSNPGSLNEYDTETTITDNVMCVEWSAPMAAGRALLSHGVYSSGWPANGSLAGSAIVIPASQQIGSVYPTVPLNTFGIGFSGVRNGSATAFVSHIYRIRLETRQ